MSTRGLTFPLVPRRRLLGLAFGAIHGARRGTGPDVAGARPYRPGDDRDAIDWAASARISAALGTDEFVVREHFADEAPRAVIVADRRPEMALCPPELPWLRKNEAMRVAAELIAESVAEARGLVGYLDFAEGEPQPFWRPPVSQTEHWAISERHLRHPTFQAPPDTVERTVVFLAVHGRSGPPGSFAFVLSYFLVNPARDVWERALERRWDIVPVVIQDPIWEASFPDVSSVVVPLADPRSGRVSHVRLTPAEARERRIDNERRRERLLAEFASLGLEPVLVEASARESVLRAFLAWAEERTSWRRAG